VSGVVPRYTRFCTHHRHTLPAVLDLANALLILNAWLVSQQLFDF